MKLKHYDIEIPKDNPFQNCKLERKKYAQNLTDIVDNNADGFVLAINNEWGAGKTTFVKMWRQELNNNKFKTLYFNAWENDFDTNPLVAFISELKEVSDNKSKKNLKSLLEKGALLVKNVAPKLIKGIVKKHVADIDENIIDSIEETAKSSLEILEEEIKLYTQKKQTIIEFRNELTTFANSVSTGKPLVFIIDELDRCRPTYAVELLEQIKHIFLVPGIIFILAIDKEHLKASVKGFYGTDQIDADEYLRRFIDLEYSIPRPSNIEFSNYLFNYFDLGTFFNSKERLRQRVFASDAPTFLRMAQILFDRKNVTLRQQEKAFAFARLILNTIPKTQYCFPTLLFVLIYFKMFKSSVYKKLDDRSLSINELIDEFDNLFNQHTSELDELNLVFILAMLLHFYSNDLQRDLRQPLITRNNKGEIISQYSSKLERTKEQSLANYLDSLSNQHEFSHLGLIYLTSKINVTEPILKDNL